VGEDVDAMVGSDKARQRRGLIVAYQSERVEWEIFVTVTHYNCDNVTWRFTDKFTT